MLATSTERSLAYEFFGFGFTSGNRSCGVGLWLLAIAPTGTPTTPAYPSFEFGSHGAATGSKKTE
jgi:hypothetical protein